jgi:hypothetical protein
MDDPKNVFYKDILVAVIFAYIIIVNRGPYDLFMSG